MIFWHYGTVIAFAVYCDFNGYKITCFHIFFSYCCLNNSMSAIYICFNRNNKFKIKVIENQ